jgi:AcrR family transcriptional regulator
MDRETKVDRRVQRTERALSEALFALIQVKSYDRVTVQDIIERANVGRSTFYSHFDTKDDLLLSRLSMMTFDIDQRIAESTEDTGPVLPSLGLFEHVVTREPMFRALFGSSGIDLVTREARRIFCERALRTIRDREARGATHPTPAHIRAAFLAGSLLALVQWWLDDGLQVPPAQMDEIFQRSVSNA